jgi:hypothetical protein
VKTKTVRINHFPKPAGIPFDSGSATCRHEKWTIRQTVRVGQLDVAMAGAPVWVVAGPVHEIDPGTARNALRAALTSADLCVPRVRARTDGGNGVT